MDRKDNYVSVVTSVNTWWQRHKTFFPLCCSWRGKKLERFGLAQKYYIRLKWLDADKCPSLFASMKKKVL
jgi:hypothetical protein